MISDNFFEKLNNKTPEEVYDELYQLMEELFKKYDPCKIFFMDNKFYCTRDKSNVEINGCCSACKYFEDKCTVQCLACKMWICKEAFYSLSSEVQKKWKKEVKEINEIRLKKGIRLYFRASKEDHFDLSRNPLSFNDFVSDWFIGKINFSFNQEIKTHNEFTDDYFF